MSDNGPRSDVNQLFAEGSAIDAALNRAVQEALWWHKQAGNPIAVWRDGQVVWVPPEEIDVERPEKLHGPVF
ncbi:MAG: hypothetical protein HY000_37480 [Planctomycetes bacterium]|nr:hypothetical protein [Planctomycetota bacterium]